MDLTLTLHEIGVVLKKILTNARLLALLLTIAVLATACGGDGGQQGVNPTATSRKRPRKAVARWPGWITTRWHARQSPANNR
jgi:hypothetical protein